MLSDQSLPSLNHWSRILSNSFHRWIGAEGGTHISRADPVNPQRGDRHAAFERVFSAMWTEEEIASGEAFKAIMA